MATLLHACDFFDSVCNHPASYRPSALHPDGLADALNRQSSPAGKRPSRLSSTSQGGDNRPSSCVQYLYPHQTGCIKAGCCRPHTLKGTPKHRAYGCWAFPVRYWAELMLQLCCRYPPDFPWWAPKPCIRFCTITRAACLSTPRVSDCQLRLVINSKAPCLKNPVACHSRRFNSLWWW